MGDLAVIEQEMTRLFEQLLGHGAHQSHPADGAWSSLAFVVDSKFVFRVQV